MLMHILIYYYISILFNLFLVHTISIFNYEEIIFKQVKFLTRILSKLTFYINKHYLFIYFRNFTFFIKVLLHFLN